MTDLDPDAVSAAWQRDLAEQVTEAAKRGESVTVNQPPQQGARQATVAIVVYCPRCDYFRKVAVQEGSVGTHGCAQCDGSMEVYIAYKGADHVHT